MNASIRRMVEAVTGSSELQSIGVLPLRSGLDALSVAEVRAEYRDGAGRLRCLRFICKELTGPPAREVEVYRRLVLPYVPGAAPALLGTWSRGAVRGMALERIVPVRRWPWAEPAHGVSVLRTAARLHGLGGEGAAAAVLPSWDYETELKGLAASTVDAMQAVAGPEPAWRRSLPALRRLSLRVGAMGRDLERFSGRAVLHGDLHPGNVLVRRKTGRDEPVLLDWGRARIGSPLEDVASWLQALRCWEREAMRRHDSLLAAYLAESGGPRAGPSLREAYWMAAARNALSGSLLHHLTRWRAAPSGRAASSSRRAAEAWLRVIRRADAAQRG